MDNYTINYRDRNLTESTYLWLKLPDRDIGLLFLLFAPTMLLGFLGNACLIFVVFTTVELRNATNLFIANMSLVNLLLTCICSPIYILKYANQFFVMGEVICKAFGSLQVGFMMASGLSIVVISFDRFRGIVYPFSQKLNMKWGLSIIGIIWLGSILFSYPFTQFRKYKVRQWADYTEIFCGEDIQRSRTYWTAMMVSVIYVPVVAVIIAYTVIILHLDKYERKVRNREHPSKAKNRRKVIRMLFIILMVHFLSWIPFQVIILYRVYIKKNNMTVPQWQRVVDFIAHYLAYTSGAINPFIYGASNDNYRKSFFKMFPFFQKKNKVKPFNTNSYIELKRRRQEQGNTDAAVNKDQNKPKKTVVMMETVSTIHIPD